MNNNKNNDNMYINNKVPKLDNKINKYHKNIRFDFKGKAYITNNGLTLEKEIKPGDKITENGEYLIKFINEKGKIDFIKVKVQKLNILFILILLALFIMASLFFLIPDINIDKQLILGTLGFDYQFIGDRYVFNISYGDKDYKEVELLDKVTNTAKIYPGASGSFDVYISTIGGNKDIEYKMQVEQEENKPSNLKFKVGNTEYNSMKEVSYAIRGSMKQNSVKKIRIDWNWEFEAEDDSIDTFDGTNYEYYSFLMSVTGM